MARGAPSTADQELIERLAALGVAVSAAQLERWRTAGLMPRHERRWPGRGRGSVSVLAEQTVHIASALGRHARPGRDLRWTVIAWYAEAGRPALPGQMVVPEPPWPAVRQALVWAMRRSPAQRLVMQARAAADGGDQAQDAFYAEAKRVVGQGPAGPPHPDQSGKRSRSRAPKGTVKTNAAGDARQYAWPRPSAWAPKKSAARPSSTRSPP